MKNYFHSDVDNENLEIASKLFDDSNTITNSNISKPTLDSIISKSSSKKAFKPSQVFAIASALVASLLLLVVLDYSSKVSSTSGLTTGFENNYYNSVTFAEEYEQIKDKIIEASYNSSSKVAKYNFDMLTEELYAYDNSDTSIKDGSNNLIDSVGSTVTPTSKTNYYDTNEQTENIHEADIVKTNGEYIYTLDGNRPTRIYVTKVDGFNMKNVNTIRISLALSSSLPVEPEIEEFYLYDNYLVALVYDMFDVEDKTYIIVYDISNPNDIKLLSSHCQDGEYISSRMKDNFLYTITTDDSNMDFFNDHEQLYSINEPKEYIPEVDGCLISPIDICIPEEVDSADFTVVTGLDVTKSDEFNTVKSILGGADNIYVSENNIYVLNNNYITEDISYTKLGQDAAKRHEVYEKYEYPLPENYRDRLANYVKNPDKVKTYLETEIYTRTNATEIIKFSFNNADIEYVANNTIPGSAENNLNFDEYKDFLRGVTTEKSDSKFTTYINCYDKKNNIICRFIFEDELLESDKETNNVIVLSDALENVAIIDGLAEDESIYSARYLGKYGYFVTYKETDPLFSVDFSDIHNPKIIGELKMPGVSEYLHFYNNDLLLGFGYEDDENSFASNLKLEMYNVSNGSAKKESKKIISDFSYSEALEDYKAIMVDSNKNIIGFAVEKEVNWNQADLYYMIYQYNNNKFEELLRVNLPNYAMNIRGFYIGDYLYIVCPEYSIRALNIKTYNEDKKVEKLKLE